MSEHRPLTYVDLMTAIDALMLAHSEEVRGGRTEELRAETTRAYAHVAHLVRAATVQPAPPPAPEDDPRLPKRRPARPR